LMVDDRSGADYSIVKGIEICPETRKFLNVPICLRLVSGPRETLNM